MTILFKNFAASTLASSVSVAATSMTVAAGQGDLFPVVVAPDVAYVVLEDATNKEVVKITERASGADTMTIVKGQEGTTDRAWLTGDIVSMRLTAASAQAGANAPAELAAHAAAADPHPGYLTLAEADAAYQPMDPDLTAMALLETNGLIKRTGAGAASIVPSTSAGEAMISAADVAAQKALLGLYAQMLNGVLSKSAAHTVIAADRGSLIDCTGTWTLTLAPAATLGAGFAFAVRNSGTGTITIDPDGSELIDGVTTITLAAGEFCLAVCDGTAWKTVGRTVTSNVLCGFYARTTAGSGLTASKPAEATKAYIVCIGGGGGGSAVAGYDGGGGGGYCAKYTAVAGDLTVTVGYGGSVAPGGASSVSGGGIATLTAAGGAYGYPTGSGGVASGGDVNITGARGYLAADANTGIGGAAYGATGGSTAGVQPGAGGGYQYQSYYAGADGAVFIWWYK